MGLKGPRDFGAETTHNMYDRFSLCGFKDVKNCVDLINGLGLKRGDILLNDNNHTCLCIGNGKVVNARTSEGSCDTADNSGNEIRIQNYWNFNPWDHVLRYVGINSASIIESACRWAEEIANNNIHGYSMVTRWGPSYDCSSLVISAYQQAFEKCGTFSGAVEKAEVAVSSPITECKKTDIPPILKKGDTGRAVGMLQQGLKDMGYNIGAVYPDNDFGSGTESGVNYLRFSYGLPQNGLADKDVWDILFS